MSLPSLTETTIRQYASEESFRRGREYYQQEAVRSLVKRGMVLQAEVEGSIAQSYNVRITFDANSALTATCTCSYDKGGWCKHIVAACMAMIHRPEMIEERPTLDALLSSLDRDRLQALVLKLAERDPSLTEIIEGQITQSSSPTPEAPVSPIKPPRQHIPVDPKAVRRQVGSIIHSLDRMRSSEAYYYVGSVVSEIGQILDQAWTLIKEDDGRTALVLLEALTEAYLSEWTNLDDSSGDVSGFFNDLGPAWTEALLSVDLSSEEREAWTAKLNHWQEEMNDYGVDDAFDAACGAALYSWDYPPLQRVLQGNITELGAWDGEAPFYADELATARLHVLERRGRLQEYLYLAEAEGQTEAYIIMLVRMNHAQEAVAYGREYLATPQQALNVATALYNHGMREESLQIAEHGLTFPNEGFGAYKAPLVKWLRDTAATMGRMAQALKAASLAFREEMNLANYLRVAELAGEKWPEERAELLDYTRHTKSVLQQGQVDVFLHEGLIDDAIAVVEPNGYYTVVGPVVDAAMESRPEWVIQACQRQAELIINGGKAHLYDAAVNWLTKARKAYQIVGRENEWQAYLAELLQSHRRKYKLVPLLEDLR